MKSFLSLTLLFFALAFTCEAQIFGRKENSSKKDEPSKEQEAKPINTDIDAEAMRFLDSLGVELGGKAPESKSKSGEGSSGDGLLSGFNPFASKEKIETGPYTEPEPIILDEQTANEYRGYLIRKSNDIKKDKPAISVKAAADRYQLQALRNAKGSELMYQGFYDHAYYVFDQIVGTDPNLKGVQFNAGYCILQGYGDPARAIPYLKSAVLNTTYKPTEPFFEMAPTDAIYWLGVAYHRLGDLVEAERKYKLFLSVSKAKAPFIEEANLGLAQIETAKKILVNPGNGKVINAESINTPYADIAAKTYNFNGNLVFASARISPNELTDTTWFNTKEARADYDLYTAERNVYLEWENPQKVALSKEYDDYPVHVSENGERLVLFQGRYVNSDIFQAEAAFESWQLGGRYFTNQQSQAWSPFAAISPDGTMAVFAANLEDQSYGGLDLYFVKKDDYGQWSDPVNLGEKINSAFDETTPSFHPNGKSVFFSSNGPNSMGGFDVFKTDIDELGVFSVPVNMKTPVNSFFDDIYFSFSGDGSYGFVSRNGGKLNKGDYDIYEINFKAINFSLNQSEDRFRGLEDEKARRIGQNFVQVSNLLTKTAERIEKSDRTGKYYIILQPGTSYRISYYEGGKEKKQETFITPTTLGLNDRKLELDPSDFGNIELTLKNRNLRSSLENEYSKSGSALKWQVFVDEVPYAMPNKEVNLLNQNGQILKSFKTDAQGRFTFSLIPDNQDYIFEVQVEDQAICDRLKVVLQRNDVRLQDYTYPVHQCF
ncbi:MAG: hypothetical protein ACPF8V_02585 [Luteibaculum sp.]